MELVFAQPPVFSQVIHIKVSFNNMQLQTSFKKETNNSNFKASNYDSKLKRSV